MPTRAASHRQLVAAAKALGHPARLRILAMLRPGSLCVCQMSAVLQLAASTVSGHLNELRRAGLVVENKVGKLVYYRLDEGSPFAPWLAQALDLVEDDQRGREDGLLARKVQGVPIPLLTQGGLTLEDLRRRRARPGPAAAAART
ncbi:MAG: winged helix-turn-helix domain-containing protein [Vicinamibacteraceae bacterium]|nr:winged helix-turn-helix domain-containing protein [Vicinamibacteraceae bacterium]